MHLPAGRPYNWLRLQSPTSPSCARPADILAVTSRLLLSSAPPGRTAPHQTAPAPLPGQHLSDGGGSPLPAALHEFRAPIRRCLPEACLHTRHNCTPISVIIAQHVRDMLRPCAKDGQKKKTVLQEPHSNPCVRPPTLPQLCLVKVLGRSTVGDFSGGAGRVDMGITTAARGCSEKLPSPSTGAQRAVGGSAQDTPQLHGAALCGLPQNAHAPASCPPYHSPAPPAPTARQASHMPGKGIPYALRQPTRKAAHSTRASTPAHNNAYGTCSWGIKHAAPANL